MNGTVREFDEAKGLGVIAATDDGSVAFHCIEIADGTRTIDVGQTVTFRPLARFGAFQAGAIEKR
jgi:cold shock CspA family protein